MTVRLSTRAAQPRSRFAFPGYPTVAAAGLYLCLSPGCARQPVHTDPGTATETATATATDTGHPAGTAPIVFPPEPPSAGVLDAMAPAPDGFGPESFAPDAGVPDASEPDLEPNGPYPIGDLQAPY